MKKIMKNMSLQWRLTLMTAAVAAAACIALTAIIGKSANAKMDEISAIFVEGDSRQIEALPIENVEIIPEYYEKLENSKANFQAQSILEMAGIILASSLLTYFVAGRALGHLEKFSERIENIQARNLSEPLDSREFPEEIGRLSFSFNEMLDRLSQSFDAQKQFSANAAHELRTPLALMQTKIDVFGKAGDHTREEYEAVLEALNVQVEHLAGIVNELLEMTELQTAERSDPISLKELVEEILCDLEYEAEQKEISLMQNPGNAQFYGNETLIYRAIFNLVENAIKYNCIGGKVMVSIDQAGGEISLSVSDTGIGIAEEYRELIFDPFFRVDKSCSRKMGGAGIGLALVKSVAELHGGSVFVKKSSSKGSEIVLTIPVPGS